MRVLSPRPELATIVPYVPGSIDEDKIILSSNESALGPSPRALEVYRNSEKYLSRYPDGGSGQLRRSLAR